MILLHVLDLEIFNTDILVLSADLSCYLLNIVFPAVASLSVQFSNFLQLLEISLALLLALAVALFAS